MTLTFQSRIDGERASWIMYEGRSPNNFLQSPQKRRQKTSIKYSGVRSDYFLACRMNQKREMLQRLLKDVCPVADRSRCSQEAV